jgi:hypothetical protein
MIATLLQNDSRNVAKWQHRSGRLSFLYFSFLCSLFRDLSLREVFSSLPLKKSGGEQSNGCFQYRNDQRFGGNPNQPQSPPPSSKTKNVKTQGKNKLECLPPNCSLYYTTIGPSGGNLLIDGNEDDWISFSKEPESHVAG